MGMMINRRRVCGGKKLPYDAEIEYLEVPANLMVDSQLSLGLKLHKDDTLILDFYMGDNGVNNQWALLFTGLNAAYDANNNFKIQRYKNGIQNYVLIRIADRWESSSMRIQDFSLNARHTINIDLHNNIVLTDGQAPTHSYNTQSPYLYDADGYMLEILKVFWTRGDSYSPQMKLYSVQIPNRADFIPVRIGQTGYLYDKISGQLHGGTLNYVLGPDK